MAIYEYECSNSGCDFKEEFIVSPSVKDPIPEVCPTCKEGKLERQFPMGKNVLFDVKGGYDYEYGKKAYKKNMTAEQQAGLLVKGANGEYANPY